MQQPQNMFPNFSIEVIDPMNRTGKISIPVSYIQETRGLHEYCDSVAAMQPKDFSLCLLFQRGSCRGGNRCHQIHANPSYVESLREKARAARSCCAHHGDVHSDNLKSTPIQITILRDGGHEECYSLSSFGRTSALDNLLRVHHRTGVELRVPASRLCRLHMASRCKFGKDCKNVHLCPQAVELEEELPLPYPTTVAVSTKRSPSLDGGDCGVSNASVGSVTPRGDSVSLEEITVAPLMQWKRVQPLSEDTATNPFGDSEFTFGASAEEECSSILDMSAFEATMQILCDDLERAEFSPNTAVRVKSQCNLLSLRE